MNTWQVKVFPLRTDQPLVFVLFAANSAIAINLVMNEDSVGRMSDIRSLEIQQITGKFIGR